MFGFLAYKHLNYFRKLKNTTLSNSTSNIVCKVRSENICNQSSFISLLNECSKTYLSTCSSYEKDSLFLLFQYLTCKLFISKHFDRVKRGISFRSSLGNSTMCLSVYLTIRWDFMTDCHDCSHECSLFLGQANYYVFMCFILICCFFLSL